MTGDACVPLLSLPWIEAVDMLLLYCLVLIAGFDV
jgi:hypothetical protein